jgi:hypothetical protein
MSGRRFRTRVHDLGDTVTAEQDLEASRQDRLEIQDTFDGTADEADRTRARTTDQGPVAHLMAVVTVGAAGAPNSQGTGLRVSDVTATEVTVKLEKPQPLPYAVIVQDQRPGSRLVYWVERKAAEFFVISATDLAGAPTDFTAGEHVFAVSVQRALRARF